jgi:hypothetical protein
MAKENPKSLTAIKYKQSTWDKALPAEARRNLILAAHHGNELAAAQTLKTLANYARDKETRQLAATDAVFLLKMSQRYLKPLIGNQPSMTANNRKKKTYFSKTQPNNFRKRTTAG